VSLELGGKSPNIVFDDVDIESVVDKSVYSVFANAGQDCCARTRFFVLERIAEQFTSALVERTRRLRVGDPRDENSEIGAIISPEQQANVERYLDIGQREGAQLLVGGTRPEDARLANGNFLMPAVFSGVRNDMRRRDSQQHVGYRRRGRACSYADLPPPGCRRD
jgi:betaine-aldehyde dehydrogenase